MQKKHKDRELVLFKVQDLLSSTTASASVCASERTQKKIKGIEQGAQRYTNAHMDLAFGEEKRQ